MLSSEIGIEKPDLRIFALAKQQAATETVVFCSEDLEHCLAAQRVGLQVRVLRLGHVNLPSPPRARQLLLRERLEDRARVRHVRRVHADDRVIDARNVIGHLGLLEDAVFAERSTSA